MIDMKRRWWAPCLLILGGCAYYPLIDLKDQFHHGQFGPNKVTPYGGVCIPQGPVTGPGLPTIPGIAVPAPGGGIIPPPAPLPPQGPNPAIFPK